MDDTEAGLAAVVAHGLLSSVAVMHAAALTLQRLGDAIPADDRMILLDAMCEQSDLLVEGTDCLTPSVSEEIATSAASLRLAGGILAEGWDRVDIDRRASLLDVLDREGDRLKTMLLHLVQGLDAEAILFLDSLAAEHR